MQTAGVRPGLAVKCIGEIRDIASQHHAGLRYSHSTCLDQENRADSSENSLTPFIEIAYWVARSVHVPIELFLDWI